MVAMSDTGAWLIVALMFAFTYVVGIYTPRIYRQIRNK